MQIVCNSSWSFCLIKMMRNSSDGRVSKTIASGVVGSGLIPARVKPKTHNWYSQLLYLRPALKGINDGDGIFKTQNFKKF